MDHASRRALLWLLVAAWLVVDVLVASTHYLQQQILGETPAAVVLWGLYVAQFATLAGWLVLGDGPTILRIPACIFAHFALYGLAWMLAPDRQRIEMWLLIGSVYAALVALPLVALRIYGVRCRLPEKAGSPASHYQYSIFQILSLTTLVAATLAILQRVKPGSLPGGYQEFMLIELLMAGIAWITWLVIFRLPVVAGLLLVLVIAPTLGMLAGIVEGMAWEAWIAFTALQGLLLAGNLLVLRVCGYELTRDPSGI